MIGGVKGSIMMEGGVGKNLIKKGVLMLKSRSCLCLMFCLLLSYALVYFQCFVLYPCFVA